MTTKEAWVLRKKRYGPSGFKDLKKYKQTLRDYMNNGGAEHLVKITRKRYGYCRCRNSELKRKRQKEKLGVINRLPEKRKANSEGLLRHWSNPEEREKHLAAINNPEAKRKSAEKTKAHYSNMSKEEKEAFREKRRVFFQNVWDNYTPEERETRIRKSTLGRLIKPNKLEQRLIRICEEYDLAFKYTGDHPYPGLHGKMPDFVSTNGEKKIIEVFGDHWHTKDEARERVKFFEHFSYDTLIIWESDFVCSTDLEIVKKIKNFKNNYNYITIRKT